jgi:hypothetical protein
MKIDMIGPETDALVEAMARAVMQGRGGCLVTDWAREGRDNPVVAQVLMDARAILPIITAHTAAAVAAERERALAQARGPITFYTKGYGPGDGNSAALTQAASHE